MNEYGKSPNGYCYKKINGKTTRISLTEFNEFKKNIKIYNQEGGGWWQRFWKPKEKKVKNDTRKSFWERWIWKPKKEKDEKRSRVAEGIIAEDMNKSWNNVNAITKNRKNRENKDKNKKKLIRLIKEYKDVKGVNSGLGLELDRQHKGIQDLLNLKNKKNIKSELQKININNLTEGEIEELIKRLLNIQTLRKNREEQILKTMPRTSKRVSNQPNNYYYGSKLMRTDNIQMSNMGPNIKQRKKYKNLYNNADKTRKQWEKQMSEHREYQKRSNRSVRFSNNSQNKNMLEQRHRRHPTRSRVLKDDPISAQTWKHRGITFSPKLNKPLRGRMRPQTRRAKIPFIERGTLQTYDRNTMRKAYNAPTSEKKRQERLNTMSNQIKKRLVLLFTKELQQGYNTIELNLVYTDPDDQLNINILVDIEYNNNIIYAKIIKIYYFNDTMLLTVTPTHIADPWDWGKLFLSLFVKIMDNYLKERKFEIEWSYNKLDNGRFEDIYNDQSINTSPSNPLKKIDHKVFLEWAKSNIKPYKEQRNADLNAVINTVLHHAQMNNKNIPYVSQDINYSIKKASRNGGKNYKKKSVKKNPVKKNPVKKKSTNTKKKSTNTKPKK